jgi:transmembrane 9 superfamily protein 2/4
MPFHLFADGVLFSFSFDFCKVEDKTTSPVENLGQVVFGERIRPSKYKVVFTYCKKYCGI